MPDLSCTCGPGESVAGLRQEIIEQRLAPLFGVTTDEIHALLDLLDETLENSFDEFPDGAPEGDTERRMAAGSGRTEGWIKNFLTSWEFTSGEVEREEHEKHGPWGGLLPVGGITRLARPE